MILKNNKYTSEITEFLIDLKKDNPGLESDQRKREGIMGQAAKKKTNENLMRLKCKIKPKSYTYFDNHEQSE